MGTVIIVKRSTLTDAAAVARVGLYLADKKDLAEVDGIHRSEEHTSELQSR